MEVDYGCRVCEKDECECCPVAPDGSHVPDMGTLRECDCDTEPPVDDDHFHFHVTCKACGMTGGSMPVDLDGFDWWGGKKP